MTLHHHPQPAAPCLTAAPRELREIDAMMDALRNYRHAVDMHLEWQDIQKRGANDDLVRRRIAQFGERREQLHSNVLLAAYTLLEIRGIYDAWMDAGGDPENVSGARFFGDVFGG